MSAQNLDFRSVILDYDRQLTQYFEEWMERFRRDSDMTGAIDGFALLVMRLMSSIFSQTLRSSSAPSSCHCM